MRFSIVTEYPIWLSIFALLIAAAYAWYFYRKDDQFREVKPYQIKIMMALRFIVVFILLILLLSPMIKSISKVIEKPVVIFAQDNSESIVSNRDSGFYRSDYQTQIASLTESLGDGFDVNFYSFGEDFQKTNEFDFSERQTDFSQLFSEIQNRYLNRNVGALIIASDGIFNKGINPVYAASDADFPVYTLALGDTSIRKDIILASVRSNKIAFLGNRFPIQAQVLVNQLEGKTAFLTVNHKGEQIFKKEIDVNNNRFSETINIDIEASETGLQHYYVSLQRHPDEVNTKNNAKDVVIDIIDSKQKILILTNAPHPDAGAIRSALEKNQNFEVDLFVLKDFKKNVNDYNMLILNQIPAINEPATKLFTQIEKMDIPVLYIIGTQSNIKAINNLNSGLQITGSRGKFDETLADNNTQFTLFELNADIRELTSMAPPLVSPFGEYSITGNSEILFYQKIRGVQTSKPQIVFSSELDKKVGFITGEGIWRWRLHDYYNHSSH